MALSTQTVTVSGSALAALPLTIGFLREEHLSVEVDGVATSAFSIAGSTMLFSPSIAVGKVVKVTRTTPKDAPINIFDGQAQWRPAVVDESFLQALYWAQETAEQAVEAGSLSVSGDLDVGGATTVDDLEITGNLVSASLTAQVDAQIADAIAGVGGSSWIELYSGPTIFAYTPTPGDDILPGSYLLYDGNTYFLLESVGSDTRGPSTLVSSNTTSIFFNFVEVTGDTMLLQRYTWTPGTGGGTTPIGFEAVYKRL